MRPWHQGDHWWNRWCVYCQRRVWPWQRFGWYVLTLDRTIRWHRDCYMGYRAGDFR